MQYIESPAQYMFILLETLDSEYPQKIWPHLHRHTYFVFQCDQKSPPRKQW